MQISDGTSFAELVKFCTHNYHPCTLTPGCKQCSSICLSRRSVIEMHIISEHIVIQISFSFTCGINNEDYYYIIHTQLMQ